MTENFYNIYQGIINDPRFTPPLLIGRLIELSKFISKSDLSNLYEKTDGNYKILEYTGGKKSSNVTKNKYTIGFIEIDFDDSL